MQFNSYTNISRNLNMSIKAKKIDLQQKGTNLALKSSGQINI